MVLIRDVSSLDETRCDAAQRSRRQTSQTDEQTKRQTHDSRTHNSTLNSQLSTRRQGTKRRSFPLALKIFPAGRRESDSKGAIGQGSKGAHLWKHPKRRRQRNRTATKAVDARRQLDQNEVPFLWLCFCFLLFFWKKIHPLFYLQSLFSKIYLIKKINNNPMFSRRKLS